MTKIFRSPFFFGSCLSFSLQSGRERTKAKLCVLVLLGCMALFQTGFAQPVTVYSENFEGSGSNFTWRASSSSWKLNEVTNPTAGIGYFTQAGTGAATDSALYALDKTHFSLISNRTYRISFACSLATGAGSKSVVFGLSNVDTNQVRRTTALQIFSTGPLQTNGWQTFTGTFNTTGNMAGWTSAWLVLWAQYLASPQNTAVFVDNIVIERLSNLPPNAVSITTPAEGFFGSSPMQINASATDPNDDIEKVQFFSGTSLLGEDLTSPYSLTANISSGNHQITAKVIDQYGLSLTSAPVGVVINSAPTAVAVSPSANPLFMTGPVTLAATASDVDNNLDKVEFM